MLIFLLEYFAASMKEKVAFIGHLLLCQVLSHILFC